MKKSTLKHRVLHRIMEQSKFALFEVCHQQSPRIQPVVVEAHAAEGEQSIWCSCDDLILPSKECVNFPVTLKFINRKKGNFIQIQGNATIGDKQGSRVFPLSVSENAQNSLIQVKVHQVAWFDKKSGEVEFFAA